jgi:hypothetical protein
MLDHVRQGVPAAQAAELASAARFTLAASESRKAAVGASAAAGVAVREALLRYDETGADRAIEPLLRSASVRAVIRDVLLPLVRELDADTPAPVTVAQSRFAAGYVHHRLMYWSRGWDRGLGPRAVLACPTGEQHCLGLATLGIALHRSGWRITYLGPETPLDTVAGAAAAIEPRLVVLVGTTVESLPTVAPRIRALAERWRVAVAGPAADAELAQSCAAVHLQGDPFEAAAAVP